MKIKSTGLMLDLRACRRPGKKEYGKRLGFDSKTYTLSDCQATACTFANGRHVDFELMMEEDVSGRET